MTILITGASSGLGRAVARQLAAAGVQHLILPVREARTGDALRSEIESLGCNNVSTPLLDLASIANVKQFAEDLVTRVPALRLEGLLLNAGTQSAHALRFTQDGYESTFAVNHLAHYGLFKGLRDQLSPTATVGWTGSGTHDPNLRAAKAFGFRGAQYHTAMMLAEGRYPGAKNPEQVCRDAYATSKWCNILMARHFGGKEAGQRRFFSFDPGLMPGTGLAREQHGVTLAAWNYVLPRLTRILPGASSPQRSGQTFCKLLQRQIHVEDNGGYFDFTGKAIIPYLPDNVQSVIDDLIRTSDELVMRA
ncbi:MAG TPA: SDR family NAD(P)-dependent oxidoreductase [Steroidobacteraceae bacterium]|jgi:NAD(P)-dependent dehydrogenase (short-subunit alcohol dehydrogenase family)|nr:SDR family NAD(P)-dependent oxidoreductase [Steroidobacteraceae bacterium]